MNLIKKLHFYVNFNFIDANVKRWDDTLSQLPRFFRVETHVHSKRSERRVEADKADGDIMQFYLSRSPGIMIISSQLYIVVLCFGWISFVSSRFCFVVAM